MGKASRRKRDSSGEDLEGASGKSSLTIKLKNGKFLQRRVFHVLLIIIVGFLAYSNTFDSPFQWDDIKHISDNSVIKDLENYTSSTKGYDFNPRRVVGYFSFALNYHFAGTDVTGYHLVNLLIHIANAILVYWLVALTFRTPYFNMSGNRQRAVGIPSHSAPGKVGNEDGPRFTIHDSHSSIALLSALLFVSHPVQTQAVTYIAQRFTSLAALFYLLSLVMYIKGRIAKGITGDRQVPMGKETIHDGQRSIAFSSSSLAWFFLSLCFAVCAMKTKEITLTLPIMIVLYEVVFFKASLKKKLIFILPVLLLLLVIPLSLLHTGKSLGDILSEVSSKTRVQTQMPRLDYFLTQTRVITTYIRLLLFPVRQNFDYDYPIYRSFFTPPVFFSSLFLAALFGTAVYLIYKSGRPKDILPRGEVQAGSSLHSRLNPYFRMVGFGILWFFLTLSVESSFIPIIDVIFEHRVYLPSVGFLISVTAGLLVIAQRFGMKKIALAVLILTVLVFTGATYARNNVWRSRIALWEDVVDKSPNKARVHNNLGIFYSDVGRFDDSIREFETALRLKPDYADALNSLGAVYSELGKTDEAIGKFQDALRIEPDFADALYNLGTAYYSRGRMSEAFLEFQEAVRVKPDFAKAHNYLGAIHQTNGRIDEAFNEYKLALKYDPRLSSAKTNIDNLQGKIRGK